MDAMLAGLIIFAGGIIIGLAIWCCYVMCKSCPEETNANQTSNTASEMDLDDATYDRNLHRAAVVALSNTGRQQTEHI